MMVHITASMATDSTSIKFKATIDQYRMIDYTQSKHHLVWSMQPLSGCKKNSQEYVQACAYNNPQTDRVSIMH